MARRRGRSVAITLVILLVVLGAGVFALDTFLRSSTADRVKAELAAQGVADTTVHVGGGLMAPQLLESKLTEVDVTAPNLNFGGLQVAGRVTAQGLDFSGALKADHIVADVRVTLDQVLELAGNPVPDATWALSNSAVTLTTQLEVMGNQVPVTFAVNVQVTDGRVLLTPGDVSVAGLTLDSGLVSSVFGGESIEVPTSWLPAGLSVTSVRVDDDAAVVEVQGDSVNLEEFGTLG